HIEENGVVFAGLALVPCGDHLSELQLFGSGDNVAHCGRPTRRMPATSPATRSTVGAGMSARSRCSRSRSSFSRSRAKASSGPRGFVSMFVLLKHRPEADSYMRTK